MDAVNSKHRKILTQNNKGSHRELAALHKEKREGSKHKFAAEKNSKSSKFKINKL